MAVWKLTIRHGSTVAREQFDDLDAAVAELRRCAEEVRAEGGLKQVSALRDFEPADQVQARLEISGRGILRPPTAGIDVRGDGSMVAFSGSVRRQQIEPSGDQTVFEVVRSALDGRR